MEYEENINRSRLIVGDIVLKLNFVELCIKDIIAFYLDSQRTHFVNDVLLNNLIVNMSAKIKILQYIVNREKITLDKDFTKSLTIVMSKRNVVAHSDKVFFPEPDIVGIDADWNPDGIIESPIYDFSSPSLSTLENGQINSKDIEEIYSDFNKYYAMALNGIKVINEHLGMNVSGEPPGLIEL